MKNLRIAVITAALASIALSACSSDPADSPRDDGVIELDVSVLPIAHTAPIQIAISEGIFEKHGLEVTVTQATTGSAVVPSVMNESVDIAYGNLTSTLQARAQGLPIVSIATSDGAASVLESDTNWIMVRADSGIADVQDLAGKTIAVNALNGLVDLITRATIDELGGNSDDVELTEIPFPDMLGALEAGRVDAVSLTEPFRTIGLQNQENVALAPVGSIGGTRPGLIVDTYFTSEGFLSKNEEAVERFQTAIYEAQQLAIDDPAVAREAISSYLDIPEPILQAMNLPQWATDTMSDSDFQFMVDLMVTFGLMDEDSAPSYDDVVRE
ncbi:ABC transporter substrate-binding protein [Nocardioides sp. L-11A]|uniref:ABC transporter substrate-binding protein n=1 Tax=Nocardioides sp. L-11A TaxID=3043848 RepID=UPI00249CE958|nr:ABC transporter substrate-binding protein [Nocardioides sp. L-11A]